MGLIARRNPKSKLKSPKGNSTGKAQTSTSKITDTRSSKSQTKTRAAPSRQQKTKPATTPQRKKPRVYSEKELGIPILNTIVPVGVQKPRGKKKGKVFVDDAESMMTIFAIVNADKEGQIESKIMKARQMEEIREARRQEQEAKHEARKSKLEDAKESVRRRRKRKQDDSELTTNEPLSQRAASKSKKRVSFG